MTDRQLTFIDVDENFLVVWLKDDRIELRVVDSRPELEAAELRAFASVLFATYVGGPLGARLEAACAQITGVRERLAATGAVELMAELERSLGAIAEVAAAITGVRPAVPAPVPNEPAAVLPVAAPATPRRAKRRRGMRAGEGELPAWGWVRHSVEDATPVAA